MNKPDTKPILIMGIGNFLLGDEGVGIHALRLLEKKIFLHPIELLDGGCGALSLMSYFLDYPVIIMIDAARDSQPVGTVSKLQPSFASDFPKSLSAHDVGLRDLIESVTLIGKLPKIYLITVSISDIRAMSTELTLPVQDSLSTVVRYVVQILEEVII
jgi:hydrogenase maturation protease